MADYLAKGNKTVKCTCCGCMNKMSFQTTIYKCPMCNKIMCVFFSGTVTDKHGNYVPYHTQ